MTNTPKFILKYGMIALTVGFATVGAGFGQESLTEAVSPVSNLPDSLRAMALTAKAFRATAEKVRPALVTIESFGGVSAIQGKIGGIRQQGEGNTTGVMISPDGYIVTSTFNFIQRPPVITVITADGDRHVAQLLGRDETRKLCLLKIEGVSDMPVLESVDPQKIVVGQWAVSVGVGYGDANPAISSGIISAKNRVGGKALQTDANISPACYGGPLVDLQGRLIGICVPLNPQSQALGAGVEWYDSGIGFAIPLFGAEKLLDRLKNGERIASAFLGIQGIPDPGGKGIWIERVEPKSAAESAGLKIEDIIVSVAGVKVRDLMSLKHVLSRYEAGSEVELEYIAYQQPGTTVVTITLGEPPADPKQNQLEPPKIR